MNKAIVTTTINEPTEAIIKFCEIAKRDDWRFYIVGDLKTPHEAYYKLEDQKNVFYIPPTLHDEKYKKLADIIGHNTIQRRNFGFIDAWKNGAEVIATIDDDNIPYYSWGKELFVNELVDVNVYVNNSGIFDPLSLTNKQDDIWHRGFPLRLINEKNDIGLLGLFKKKILVQADLWDGAPDIDAINRALFSEEIDYLTIPHKFNVDAYSPFNSQNTFLSREVFPTYFLFPFIGRMDDIWASYLVEKMYGFHVLYNKASVYQKRNEHNLRKDFNDELYGYSNTYDFIRSFSHGDWTKFLPIKSIRAYEAYKEYFI